MSRLRNRLVVLWMRATCWALQRDTNRRVRSLARQLGTTPGEIHRALDRMAAQRRARRGT